MGRQAEGPRRTWDHPGRRSSWPAALLAVSLLLPPAAGLSVTPEPERPVEGQSVTLTPQGLSDSFISCAWYRGETTLLPKRIFIYYPAIPKQVHGDAYTGRETRVQNCSLQISDLMQNYSGIYTVVEETDKPVQASVNITVSDSKPIGGGGLSGGAIAGIVIGVLAGVALIAGLVYYLCAKTSLGRTDQHASNGNIPSAPGRNQGATDTKPTSREEDIQYSTLAFNKTNASPPQPASEANQPLDSSTIYSEIKKK